MTALERLRESMLNGYTVPRSMEWLLWPIGYKPPEPAQFVGQEGDNLIYRAYVSTEQQNIVPLARKFFEIRLPGTKGFWERANEMAAADRRAAERRKSR